MRVPILGFVLLAGCGGSTKATVSDPAPIYTPDTDGTDTRLLGFTGHAGVELLVVSIDGWTGARAYAMRIDASGAPLGDLVALDSSFLPQQQVVSLRGQVALFEAEDGWAVLESDKAAWVDASGNVTIVPHSTFDSAGTLSLLAGAAPNGSGLSAFVTSPCGVGDFQLTRFDLGPAGESSSPVTSCASVEPMGAVFAAAFDAKVGGAVVRFALPRSGELTALDVAGNATGATTTFAWPAGAFPGSTVARPNGAAFVLQPQQGFGSAVLAIEGARVRSSPPIPGAVTAMIATPKGYRLTYDVTYGACGLGACLVDLDTDAHTLSMANVTAADDTYHDGGMNRCTHPVLGGDGAGGRLLALCSDGAGFVARTAPATPAPAWVDSWRMPGSIFSLDAHGGPGGAIVAVVPFHHRDGGASDFVPLDATGAPAAGFSGTLQILDVTGTGYVAANGTELLLLDGAGATSVSIDLHAPAVAAAWTGDGGILLDSHAAIFRFDAQGALTLVGGADSTFAPTSICPAASDGAVLVYGKGARRMSSSGSWLDEAAVAVPPNDDPIPPRGDCWSCGASCWVVARADGAVFRVDADQGAASTTPLMTLPRDEIAAGGAGDHAVLAAIDVASSTLVVQPATARGVLDGPPTRIPMSADVLAGDLDATKLRLRRIGVAPLDARHLVVVYVGDDGGRERVERRVIAF